MSVAAVWADQMMVKSNDYKCARLKIFMEGLVRCWAVPVAQYAHIKQRDERQRHNSNAGFGMKKST